MPEGQPQWEDAGKFIQEARKAKGMSQSKLGQALGFLRDDQVRLLEKGLHVPTVDLLPKIRDALALPHHGWLTLLKLYGIEEFPVAIKQRWEIRDGVEHIIYEDNSYINRPIKN